MAAHRDILDLQNAKICLYFKSDAIFGLQNCKPTLIFIHSEARTGLYNLTNIQTSNTCANVAFSVVPGEINAFEVPLTSKNRIYDIKNVIPCVMGKLEV